MRESKLYKAIIQLNGHELNRLHRFVLSPYFNNSEAIIKLFDWIKDDLKTEHNQTITRETLWRLCFGKDEPFNDGRMRKVQSDLLRLVENYFAQEAYELNPLHKANYLIEAISNKRLEALQSSTMRSAKRLTETQVMRPASFYYYQYELERNIYSLEGYEVHRSERSNIESISKNLDHFYIAEKLRNYCTVLSRLHLKSHNYDLLFIDQIIDHVAISDYENIPPIQIYYQIHLTYLDSEDSQHYTKLRQYITKYIHLFPESEAKEIIDSALNYCISRMNAGIEAFVREAFDLYKEAIENKLLFIKGKITPWSFKNIVTIGLRLYEFDWVERFISDFSAYLELSYRDNAITFNLAQLFFYKKEYLKVIHQLSQVEYDDITYNLNSKTLLMASYYELDELEALSSLLDAFRIYLSRNKELPTTRRKHYLNTISIVRKLAKLKAGDKKEIEKLTKEVENTQGVVSKNWILEKLVALK